MLHFIYSDKFPSVHELTGPDSICTSTIMVQHILVAADRYGLERLRLLCEAKLCEELTTDTVVTTLALADQHQCAQLKSACLKFMAARENLGGWCSLFRLRIYAFSYLNKIAYFALGTSFSVCTCKIVKSEVVCSHQKLNSLPIRPYSKMPLLESIFGHRTNLLPWIGWWPNLRKNLPLKYTVTKVSLRKLGSHPSPIGLY